MKRLTYEKMPSQFNRGKYPTKYTSRHTFQEVVARLAAYEDTGLEPEEAEEHEAAYIEIMTRTYGPLHQKIIQWLKAEKEGRLVVLPCKVGDIVYELIRYCDDQICDKKYLGCEECPGYNKEEVRKCRMGSVAQIAASMPYIGEIVFLTREEAEAALKKMEEADNEAD